MGIEVSINLYKLHIAYTINKAIIEGNCDGWNSKQAYQPSLTVGTKKVCQAAKGLQMAQTVGLRQMHAANTI